jgi:hypothetical protein
VEVERGDVVAAELAPGGEQRVRVQVQVVGAERVGLPGLARVAALVPAQQLLPRDDVRPVVAAGVVDADEHLRPLRDAGEHLERLQRQRGDPEDQHAAGERGGTGRGFEGARAFEEGFVDGGATAGLADSSAFSCAGRGDVVCHVLDQPPPQRRLPALVVGERLRIGAEGVGEDVVARRPPGEPVGAIHLVLVEEIGKALGKLEALAQQRVSMR